MSRVSLTFAPGARCSSMTTEFRIVSNAFTGRNLDAETALKTTGRLIWQASEALSFDLRGSYFDKILRYLRERGAVGGQAAGAHGHRRSAVDAGVSTQVPGRQVGGDPKRRGADQNRCCRSPVGCSHGSDGNRSH